MKSRCFLVYALAPEGMAAAEANERLNVDVTDLADGPPVFDDHFTGKPHGGIAVVFPRDEDERARLDDPGPLAGCQIAISALTFSPTPVGFAAQTPCTVDEYGQTSLEQLGADEEPNPGYWWQTRSA